MKLISLVVAGIMMASQAAALSCMRPDPVQTFDRVSDDPAPYYLLYGTLEFDASQQPQAVVNAPTDPSPIPAQFRGHGLTLNGFTSRFDQTVTLQPVCAGSWCGRLEPAVKSLFFAKVQGEDVIITADPCGGTVFPEPQQSDLDAMTACINGNCP